MTVITAPATQGFRSRAASGHAAAEFHRSLARVARAAAEAETSNLPAALIDYLASRVESHSPEAARKVTETLPNDAAESATRFLEVTGMIQTEAARTACVALGLRVEGLAPSDFPALTRYWLACRVQFGAL